VRLERIGDLLMAAGAIDLVRQRAPGASIDLVVGSWNEEVARTLPGVDRVEVLDAPWLARGGSASHAALVAGAWEWRRRRYDLAINFEGDIRSHALMALSRAPVRVGFDMAGGGPLLTRRVAFRPDRHTSVNCAALVTAALGGDAPAEPPPFRLTIPADARARAQAIAGGGARLVALHASGGRPIKQWDPDRFAEAGARVARELDATLVLTGGPGDRAITAQVRGRLPRDLPVVDLTGEASLLTLAAVLERCALLLTGDTGPMHLAAACGTPIVAIFGPSLPARYAPVTTRHRVVRIDLPCAPCNRIRNPPARCQGHTPDCLVGVEVDMVLGAARDLLRGESAR
jgi:ADP-heptose:LPS heptosyltransferase